MSSNWRVPGITILPHVCGIHSCPNIMNSKHPTFTFGTALLPPFTAASPTSVTVTEVTADFSGCSGAFAAVHLIVKTTASEQGKVPTPRGGACAQAGSSEQGKVDGEGAGARFNEPFGSGPHKCNTL